MYCRLNFLEKIISETESRCEWRLKEISKFSCKLSMFTELYSRMITVLLAKVMIFANKYKYN